MSHKVLTTDLLNHIFEYSDGYLLKKVRITPGCAIGDKVGSYDSSGYLCTSVLGIKERVHRLIWIMFNGIIPIGMTVDHKDNNPKNNRIENLRLATQGENNCNQRLSIKENKSGFKGVHFVPRVGRYRAMITLNGKAKHLGYFIDPNEAHDAYVSEAKKQHGEFANY